MSAAAFFQYKASPKGVFNLGVFNWTDGDLFEARLNPHTTRPPPFCHKTCGQPLFS